MGKASCYDGNGLKKGSWTAEEDRKLVEYVNENGHGSWRKLPKLAGLNRCGKSCRLRWTNYLRPDIKRGKFSGEEEQIIVDLHAVLGNKWSAIAGHLPGRTDNEIKNFWNTHLRKKLMQMGIDPVTHKPRTDLSFFADLRHFFHVSNVPSSTNDALEHVLRLHSDSTQLAKIQLLQNILQVLSPSPLPFVQMNHTNYQIEEAPSFPAGVPSQNHSYFNRFGSTQELFLDDFSASNQLPSLISVSSETPPEIQMENKISPDDYMIESNWKELIDSDEAIDLSYWREIVDQANSDQP